MKYSTMSERQIGEKSFGDVFYNDEEYWFKCKIKIVVAAEVDGLPSTPQVLYTWTE